MFETINSRGENANDLIEEKMDREGLSYEAASREVVAEAMTDVLPDSHFVENLAQKHKSIFTKMAEKLREFAENIRQYFTAIGTNRSREANALKEQLNDTVRYVDSIVKLFDSAAEQAVENFQKAYAVDEAAVTQGKEESNERGNHKEAPGSNARARTENENGPRVPQGVRGGREESRRSTDQLAERHGRLKKQSDEYHLEFVVDKAEDWPAGKEGIPAYCKNGVIHVLESGHSEYDSKLIPHEATHAMKQLAFKPYLDFLETVPERINLSSKDGKRLLTASAQHTGINLFNMTPSGETKLYDKLAATIAGDAIPGTDAAVLDVLNEIFYDYGAFKAELLNIHQQFKNRNNTVDSTVQETAKAETQPAGQEADSRKNTAKTYGELEAALKEYTTVYAGGMRFEYSEGDGGKYYCKVTRDNAALGGMVNDARANVYSAGPFDSRAQAIDDLVGLAKNGGLLGKETIKEVKEDGGTERADSGAVQQPEPDGTGTARVLEEVQAPDVQGDGTGRGTVRPGNEGGRQAERDGDSADADTGTGRSEGSSESGNLRRDGVTAEEKAEKKEQLHKTVTQEVEQKSTETPKGRNYVIGDSLNLPNGDKARYKANVEAIRLIKTLDSEGRYATAAEQEVLSRYVGWGGISSAFGEMTYNYDTHKKEMTAKKGWENEFTELRSLVEDGTITEQEYNEMRSSTTNAYYTSVDVIRAMYDVPLVGQTPDVWKQVGFNALPVTMNQTHVNYALSGTKDSDHFLGEALLKQIPEAIQKPLAIIQSQSPSKSNRAVVILKMEHNGKNVVSAVEVDGQGMTNNIRIDSNAMTTLFAKGNSLKQLKTAIDNTVNGSKELFYWNKKEAVSLLQQAGLQLPGWLPQDGFVNSIRDTQSNVKVRMNDVTESQQFKRWFGNSKLVNRDGTPKRVYHWTSSEFTVFDTEQSGRNQGKTHGDGIYLSTSKNAFAYAGDTLMELYASIKHPFEMRLTRAQAEKVYEKYAAPHHDDKYGVYRPTPLNH